LPLPIGALPAQPATLNAAKIEIPIARNFHIEAAPEESNHGLINKQVTLLVG
jgi:hypothetical protein